jgi:glutaconate CoA-transferase subunit B
MLAQKTKSPNLTIIFEAGGVAPLVPEMPISVGDSRTTWKACMASSMPDVMETGCRGMLDYTFLGGAEIDMYGNLNSTRIGPDHQKPKVRFPGSGGANDFASFCWRMMVMTPQDPKRFVERCTTSRPPGWIRAAIPCQVRPCVGAGPYKRSYDWPSRTSCRIQEDANTPSTRVRLKMSRRTAASKLVKARRS